MSSSTARTIGRLTIAPRDDREIVLTRTFDVPRARVFEGWTDAALMRRWLGGPPGWSLTACEVDARVGGVYRFVWRGPDGGEMSLRGTYREIAAPTRIVGAEVFEPACFGGEVVVTVTLDVRGGGTLLTMAMRYDTAEARDGALASPMGDGIAGNLDGLATLLAGAPARSAQAG